MSFFDGQRILVAICSPHRKIALPNGKQIVDTVTVDWHRHRTALSTGTNSNFVEFYADGFEVGEAREMVTRRVLAHEPCPEFIFWLDDDVLPQWDAFTKLLFRARCYPDHDVFAGVYACKGLAEPLVYAGNGAGPFWDWALGDVLTTGQHGISGCHSGLTLVRTSLYRRMLEAGVVTDDSPFYLTVSESGRGKGGNMQSRQGTEDLYFAHKAQEAGAKFLIDTSVLAGHICKKTGITWGLPENSPPVQRARWLGKKDRADAGEKPCPACEGKGHLAIGMPLPSGGFDCECKRCHGSGTEGGLKLALDIGAGGTRREWPGHKTYTTDIRADAKPDYVQDTLLLNLPPDHYDLVASAHHLEHLGRWDQEKAWKEIYKVTKPGGRIEIIVPSGEWAAHKIVDGQCDEHCLDVLYGAQEEHGYERQYNLHFFVYTKDIARALAEAAGFADVTCEDWRDNPDVAYNLTIRGRKPEAAAEEAA